jgi:hypothetical protein
MAATGTRARQYANTFGVAARAREWQNLLASIPPLAVGDAA